MMSRIYRKIIIGIVALIFISFLIVRFYNTNCPVMYISQIYFSRDGNEIASGGANYIWSSLTGEVVDDFEVDPNDAEFSPDGRYLLITLNLRLYDRQQKKIVYRRRSSNAVFSIDGKSIIFIDDSDQNKPLLSAINTEKQYSMGSVPVEKLKPEPAAEEYQVVALDGYNNDILAAIYKVKWYHLTFSGKIEIYNITTGKMLKMIDLPIRIKSVVFDGSELVVAGENDVENRIIRIDISDYSQNSSNLDFECEIESLSDDGKLLVCSFIENKKIFYGVYDLSLKKMISKVPLWSMSGGGTKISPDGRVLAIGASFGQETNGEIRLFDVATGNFIRKLSAPVNLSQISKTLRHLDDPQWILFKMLTGKRS